MTMFFLWPLLRRGSREILTLDMLQDELIEVIETRRGYHWFVALWDARVRGIMRAGVRRASADASAAVRKEKSNHGHLLLWTILWAHRRRLLPLVFLSLVISVIKFVPPYLLGKLLDFLQAAAAGGSQSGDGGGDGGGDNSSGYGSGSVTFLSSFAAATTHPPPPPSLTLGMILVLGMVLGSVSCALLISYSRVQQMFVTTEIRATLAAMVFRKALRLSPEARQQSTTGEILNHMSKDVEEWSDGVGYMIQMLSFSVQILVALFLLYHTVGIAALGTVLGMCLVVPLHIWRAKRYGWLIRIRMKYMDERVRRITEVLSGIKVVKLYGWEDAYLERIRSIRALELGLLRHLGYFFGIMSIIFISAPSLFSLITFTAFALWGGDPVGTPGTFTPKVVFVSLTLFNMLRDPIGKLSEATTCTIDIVVAMRRVQRFLLREELDPHQIDCRPQDLPLPAGTPMIAIRHATFSWHGRPYEEDHLAQGQGCYSSLSDNNDQNDGQAEREPLLGNLSSPPITTITTPSSPWTTRPTLSDITLDLPPNQLTAIVGRVGQGKSSLLSAMLGEMYLWQGSVTLYGRRQIAYVPQQAWIMNATVRANILFGQPYDAERYEAVVSACCLEPDLATLPAGDATEIGERGINLSGGQKQRVALARAAYAREVADVYLLDDPLSAVDAHVDRHLWERLIGPQGLLRDKTRVLVTHGIHHLRQVDHIVVLKDGQVAEQGRYAELMAQRQIFYRLIKEYSVAERMERKKQQQQQQQQQQQHWGFQGGEAGEAVSHGDGPDDESSSSLLEEDEDKREEDVLAGRSDGGQEAGTVPEAQAETAAPADDSEDVDIDDTTTDGTDKVVALDDKGEKTKGKQDTEAELIKQELLRTGK
ncbi:hypothetical protein DFQ27_009556, partial [Actinomortierella ambigua]